MKLKSQVAIITGSSQGIGEASAYLFAQEGAKVIIVSRTREKGEKVARRINQGIGEAIYIRADVSREEDVKMIMEKTVNKFGKIDILFNNAGVGKGIDFFDMSVEDWDNIININLRGHFLCCKYAAPFLKQEGGGKIINMSSVLAYLTLPGNTAYTASKAAIVGFTKALALDLAPYSIRVNVIIPGSIDTEMLWDGLEKGEELEKTKKEVAAAEPLGYVGKPEEIAKVALFLASDDSSFATGAPFIIDGGLLTKIANVR
jgi:meso-butanediol dehydrogenase / (S,S)-butanediol dehydrogenase / diacetyl reductase